MPGLLERRFPTSEKLSYDSSSDVVHLIGGYRGAEPIVGVRAIDVDSDVVQVGDVWVLDTASLRGDLVLKGNIIAGNAINLDVTSGNIAVIGDMGALGDLEGSGVKIQGEKGTVIVFGNIFARSIVIDAPSIILGNISVFSELKISAPSIVLGRVLVGTRNERGHAYIERSTIFQLYVHGNIEIGKKATVVLPVIASVGGSLSLQEDLVRVLSFPCVFCAETRNPFLCEHYFKGSCPLSSKGEGYDYLAKYDLSKVKEREYLSWYWRASPLMVFQNVLAKKLYYSSLKFSKSLRLDIGKKEINGIPLDQLPSHVLEQVLLITRGEVKGSFEETKQELFKTIEEFFKSRGESFIKCPHCGMPNPASGKVCVYCGKELVK
mgnify:CR=1 FL=1